MVCVLGSINVDIVLRVAQLPRCGETLSASGVMRNLGGKGANQAVAAARAGATVRMIGAVGRDADGEMLVPMLQRDGIDCRGVHVIDHVPTGSAYIAVGDAGENQIIVLAGANAAASAVPADELGVRLAQFETPLATVASFLASRPRGSVAILNAAPFRAGALGILALADIVVVNEIELAGYCDERHPRSRRNAPPKWPHRC